jgi:uncharacterized membrane protein YphA (DoxX/SURF4 family)
MTWLLIAQGLLCIAMFGSGGLKILPGESEPKKNFAKMRLPARWLAPIGTLEVLTGFGLLIGFFAPAFGLITALIATGTMAGATLAHVIQDKNGFQGIPALVLFAISLTVLLGRWFSQ